jgi:hypothetical protein
MALERETTYFEAHRHDLLEHHEGQFVLIHEDRLVGNFGTFEQAFSAGIQTVGNRPFFIKQVVQEELPQQFPALTCTTLRSMVPAHTQCQLCCL